MKTIKMIIVLGASCATFSGCGLLYTPLPSSRGHVVLSGDAPGVHALMDGLNGFITNGKASPNHDTSFYANRRAQEREYTKRALAPSWLSDLMGFKTPSPIEGSQENPQDGAK